MSSSLKESLSDAARDRQFNEWLNKPETKFIISLIPAPEAQETLTTLLRSAFQYGVGVGVGVILTEMLTAEMERRKQT